MKARSLTLIAALLVFAGCQYDSPLTDEHSVSIDRALLGVWEEIPDDGASLDELNRMVVLKFSETEYLVHYPVKKNGGYYRAYPFSLGGVEGVQLEILGSGSGPIEEDEDDIYIVASYAIINGELEVQLLNEQLVDDDLPGSAAIREAFLKNKESKDLFTDPGKFRRVENQD
jgi:hypothetical protein